jgi:hypothetical protein
MRNVKTNHKGLAACNLFLHNMLVMNRYYWENRKEIEYPIYWRKRIKTTIRAFFTGWTITPLRTEKQWERAVDRRVNEDRR